MKQIKEKPIRAEVLLSLWALELTDSLRVETSNHDDKDYDKYSYIKDIEPYSKGKILIKYMSGQEVVWGLDDFILVYKQEQV